MRRAMLLLLACGWLTLAAPAQSQVTDSLRAVDSLHYFRSDTALTFDSVASLADTSAQHETLFRRWLLPAGVIAATMAAAWMLFSVRSR